MRLDEAAAPFAHLFAAHEAEARGSNDPVALAHDDDLDIHGNHDDVANVERSARDTGNHIRSLETYSRVQGEEAQALKSVQHNEFATGGGGDNGSDGRNRRDRERAVRDLMNQLALIEQRIEWLEQRIEHLEEQLDAVEQLEALGDNLDPSNPHHAALLRAAGIDPASVDPDDPQAAVRNRRGAIETEIVERERELDVLRRERDGLSAQIDREGVVQGEIDRLGTGSVAAVRDAIGDADDYTVDSVAANSDETTATLMDEARGYSEEESQIANLTDDFLFGDQPAPVEISSDDGRPVDDNAVLPASGEVSLAGLEDESSSGNSGGVSLAGLEDGAGAPLTPADGERNGPVIMAEFALAAAPEPPAAEAPAPESDPDDTPATEIANAGTGPVNLTGLA